jgi:hypothetical protein
MFQRWISTALHGDTNKKIILIIVTAVITTNLTLWKNYIWIDKVMNLRKFKYLQHATSTRACTRTHKEFFCFMLHRKKYVCNYESLPWITSSNLFVIQWPTPDHYLYCFIFMCSSWLKKKENYVHITISHWEKKLLTYLSTLFTRILTSKEKCYFSYKHNLITISENAYTHTILSHNIWYCPIFQLRQ